MFCFQIWIYWRRGSEEESHILFGQLTDYIFQTAEFKANGLVIEVALTSYWFKLSWVTMMTKKYVHKQWHDNHFSQSLNY